MASSERQPRQVTVHEILQRARLAKPSVREENWGGHKVRIASLEGKSYNPAPPPESSSIQAGVKYTLR